MEPNTVGMRKERREKEEETFGGLGGKAYLYGM
jgi:hypothetical protein